jgi:hypothetical protein
LSPRGSLRSMSDRVGRLHPAVVGRSVATPERLVGHGSPPCGSSAPSTEVAGLDSPPSPSALHVHRGGRVELAVPVVRLARSPRWSGRPRRVTRSVRFVYRGSRPGLPIVAVCSPRPPRCPWWARGPMVRSASPPRWSGLPRRAGSPVVPSTEVVGSASLPRSRSGLSRYTLSPGLGTPRCPSS